MLGGGGGGGGGGGWGEGSRGKELDCVLFAFVYFARVVVCLFLFSIGGLAALCVCGTLWTFLFTFLHLEKH